MSEEAIIRGAKLRVTPTRVAVLRELKSIGKWSSHAEMCARLADHEPATIFRCLGDFVKTGIAIRAAIDTTWKFKFSDPDKTSTPKAVAFKIYSVSEDGVESPIAELPVSDGCVQEQFEVNGQTRGLWITEPLPEQPNGEARDVRPAVVADADLKRACSVLFDADELDSTGLPISNGDPF